MNDKFSSPSFDSLVDDVFRSLKEKFGATALHIVFKPDITDDFTDDITDDFFSGDYAWKSIGPDTDKLWHSSQELSTCSGDFPFGGNHSCDTTIAGYYHQFDDAFVNSGGTLIWEYITPSEQRVGRIDQYGL